MKKPKLPAVAPQSNILHVAAEPDKSREAQIAGIATGGSLPAAMVITQFSKGLIGDVVLRDVLASLKDHAETIKDGDLARVEAMLGGQATALNTMFAELARRGALNMGEYIGAAETYLKLALKAQSQCRATLETLAAIKSPPIFAKQANIAHGPQQVNNEAAGITRVQENNNPPTELLGHGHEQRLDTGTTAAAIGSDQVMAAVEAIHRPAHDRGENSRKP
jgi:hypothetical protein